MGEREMGNRGEEGENGKREEKPSVVNPFVARAISFFRTIAASESVTSVGVGQNGLSAGPKKREV